MVRSRVCRRCSIDSPPEVDGDKADGHETFARLARFLDVKTPPPQKPAILIVGDEPFLRFLVADVLEKEGFAVAEATNAENALRVLETRREIGIVFSDIHLPGDLDGLELVRHVQERWPHIRLLITSGRKRPSSTDMPRHVRFIAKPYSPQDLVREISRPA
jgi:CheY-like chemotaxis protein